MVARSSQYFCTVTSLFFKLLSQIYPTTHLSESDVKPAFIKLFGAEYNP